MADTWAEQREAAERKWNFTATDGMIRVIDDGRAIEHWVLNEPPNGMRKQAPATRVLPRPPRQHSPGVNAVYEMIDCIESGGTPRCSGDDAHEALEIGIATRKSHAQGGQRVDLPLEDRSLLIVPREVLMGDTPRAIARRNDRGG